MNLGSWLLWGFVSTVVLTAILGGSQGLGLTRMNIPYLLGTIFTPDRDRAKLIGVFVHFVNGWVFSLIYVAAFHAWGTATWQLGALTGLVHASFVLAVGMSVLPAIHPRMANEQYGPTVVRQLEPPGFLALHYGVRTPISVFLAHVLFGAILRRVLFHSLMAMWASNAAEAIVWAAHNYRRECYVGGSTALTIALNKIAPAIGDWYLARHGYDAQQYDGPAEPGRRHNLNDPFPGDRGAHGALSKRAVTTSIQASLSRHRAWLLLAGAGLAGLACGSLIAGRTPGVRSSARLARR